MWLKLAKWTGLLMQTHKDFDESRVFAFACDLTADDLSNHISPSSIDVVMMVIYRKLWTYSLYWTYSCYLTNLVC